MTVDSDTERRESEAKPDLRTGRVTLPPGGAKQRLLRITRIGSTGGVAVPLIVLWIVLTVWVPEFLTTVNIGNLLLASSVIGVLALGVTVVILAEEIDLSIGAIEGMGAVVAAIVIINHQVPWPLGVVIATLTGLAVGIGNGLITTFFRVPSFIVTLGMMGIV